MKKIKGKNKEIKIIFDFKLKLFLLISIVIAFVLIGLIIISFRKKTVTLQKYVSSDIIFVYDNNFKIVNDNDYVELKNNDKTATIVIKKMNYDSSSKGKLQSELSASLAYQVVQEGSYIETYNDYKSENEFTKYYYLYESNELDKQIEIIVIFGEDDIGIIIYQAENSEFDLYQESIEMIVDSLKI